MSSILDIELKSVWKYFEEISKIPRCSKQEMKIREYIKEFARRRNFDFCEDKIGNILIRKPSSGDIKPSKVGLLPILILQAHLDMVCEKNEEVTHDFSKDPIMLRYEGDYVSATNTSLGADNGIGVASMLAILESSMVTHPPLECLFTVDEEAGFTGALGIEPHFLKGRIMLNLDGEDENIYIGCAGAGNTKLDLSLSFKKAPISEKNRYIIRVGKLCGGHSGIDIHLGRANAICLLTRILWRLNEKLNFNLIKIEGGNKLNAIPREAKALILVDRKNSQALKSEIKKLYEELRYEFKSVERELEVNITPTEIDSDPEYVMDPDSKNRVLTLLMSLPHGVTKMCPNVDVVQTSTNLANVKTELEQGNLGKFLIYSMSRSCVDSELIMIRNKLKAIGKMAGAQVEEGRIYPGWIVNKDSKLLNLAKDVYQNLFNKKPSAKIVHAGLECGIIGEKFPGMDMISIGPFIENPHSIKERVRISSVSKFFKFLKGILNELSK